MSLTFAIRLALFAALVGTIGCLWVAWCEFPSYAWNDIRLAPSFALRYGITPYPTVDGGPLSTWIYGPVSMLIHLPATLASSARGAIQGSALINALVVIAPLAVIFFDSSELRTRGIATRCLALALGILLVPRPNLVLQVADHSAVAFGVLSCWLLTRTLHPSTLRLLSAAGCCTLAIWSKQIAVFLLPAQLVYLWINSRRTVAWYYFVAVGSLCLVVLGLAVSAFGFNELWLNLVAIPGRLPWADFEGRLQMRPWALIAQIAVPWLGLFALWKLRRWPTVESQSGRFLQLGAFAHIALLPIGLAGFFKIGGDTNLLHSWSYLFPGCLLAWLAIDHKSDRSAHRVLIATTLCLLLHWPDLTALPVRPLIRHFDTASVLTHAHRRKIWFPQNPLITFYTDGRLWHTEDGILTRHAANFGLRETEFRRHIPNELEAVAYPSTVDSPRVMPLLPELVHTLHVPHWKIYTKGTESPSKP